MLSRIVLTFALSQGAIIRAILFLVILPICAKLPIDTTPPPALETISTAVKTKLFTFGKAA
ncbi:MAG TPA: hypothetical protein PK125_04805 [Syntrophorhabdus sp.]|nr:hypothetical protein [Syntrophorhabdus sp.]HQB34688.1 hypothetical protein [Syntrophorhabdus sp.]HQO62488.1 hypothetical protein [Syntrophorhabdus sp.]HQP56979.1 hypothetical protein [Syntrophorhabdus sp.]